MSSIAKTITVFGGNGFLGKRICQSAISRGFNVISLSRSGTPPLSITYDDHDWISKVKWEKLDVFDPKTYVKQLQKTDVLVHTMGILLESNYKSTLNSSQQQKDLAEIVDGLKQLISPNPMTKSPATSYDYMNRQSAIMTSTNLIKSAKKNKHLKFVYISADKGFPGIPSGYINSKRQAERELIELSNENKKLDLLIVRPGFMYDEKMQGDLRSSFNIGLNLLNTVNDKLLRGSLNDLIRPSVSTQKVAQKIINCIERDQDGILSLDEILK